MSQDKKMIVSLFGIIVGIVAIVACVWFFMMLRRPNPQLPVATVTVTTVTTGGATATTTATSSVSTTAPATAATSTSALEDSLAASLAPQTDSVKIDRAVFAAEVASTTLEQARGLSYRTSLAPNAAMIFIFPTGGTQSFWMKDMNFPLDMIWISGNTVVGFQQNAPAMPGVVFPTSTYSSPANTDKVLEVNAGVVAKYKIKVGDTVTIAPLN